MESALPIEVVRKLTELTDKAFLPPKPAADRPGAIAIDVSVEGNLALMEAIDASLQQYPANTDLLLAKSSALRAAGAEGHARAVIEEILARDAEQFEARLIKQHWEYWPHVCGLPPCSEGMRRIAPALVGGLREGRNVQLVRDGLGSSVAFLQEISQFRFDHGLSNSMRCRWEFVPADTPFGRIVAHYVLVEDNVPSPYRQEFFLPTGKPEGISATGGYWLLQRLARLESALIILVMGDQVRYARRYVFPLQMRSGLGEIAARIAKDPRPTKTVEDFQRAVQWHMDHFDFNAIRF